MRDDRDQKNRRSLHHRAPWLLTFYLFLMAQYSSVAYSEIPTDYRNSLVHSAKQLRTVKECGVKEYHSKPDKLCGIKNYLSKAAPPCPVIYHERTDAAKCGVSYGEPYTDYVERCEKIASGPAFANGPTEIMDLPRGTCGHMSFPIIVETTIYPKYPKTCRHESFGIEGYQTCENKAFGPKEYLSCQHESFGIKTFHTCEIMYTREEIEKTLVRVEELTPHFEQQAALDAANYYFRTAQKESSYCLIDRQWERWGETDAVIELIAGFEQQYHESFVPGAYTCPAGEPQEFRSGLTQLTCSDYSVAEIRSAATRELEGEFFVETCQTWHSYQNVRYWLEFHYLELMALRSDLVAQQDKLVAQRLLAAAMLLEDALQ